jgi:hypothetical protein
VLMAMAIGDKVDRDKLRLKEETKNIDEIFF